MYHALEDMKAKVNGDVEQKRNYLLYSAHDYQVANMLEWLQPIDLVLNSVPYAS